MLDLYTDKAQHRLGWWLGTDLEKSLCPA